MLGSVSIIPHLTRSRSTDLAVCDFTEPRQSMRFPLKDEIESLCPL
jgi:hypothetical protein